MLRTTSPGKMTKSGAEGSLLLTVSAAASVAAPSATARWTSRSRHRHPRTEHASCQARENRTWRHRALAGDKVDEKRTKHDVLRRHLGPKFKMLKAEVDSRGVSHGCESLIQNGT